MWTIQLLFSSFIVWCIVVCGAGLLRRLCRRWKARHPERVTPGPFSDQEPAAPPDIVEEAAEERLVRSDADAHPCRFAILICAHNEEQVLGHILQDLAGQHYPAALRKVFVFADHCTDGTVALARSFAGVTVWEHTEGERSSKGKVLNDFMPRLLALDEHFDAIVLFDADNQIGPGFLARMNQAFAAGAAIVTGRRQASNPYDSLISQWYTLYWAMLNSLYNLPRYELGLSAMVSGTGFAFRTNLLRRGGWHSHSVSEDIEFTFQQNLAGHRVVYLDSAFFYDEQPTRFSVMWSQLRRWCTGGNQVCQHYFRDWVTAFAARPSWRLFDIMAGVYLTGVFGLTAVAFAFNAYTMIRDGQYLLFFVPTVAGYAATIVTGWIAARLSGWPARKLWKGIVTMPLFYSLLSYISLLSLFKRQTLWVKIDHHSRRRKF
ncbi:MAG: glycosyltransferase family 2 protein [Succiniclasticum sp.]|jgi:cellulose synthase/poly-beta-1,6-N-acetylglucosamine synthase-like glycosyltransferase